MHDALGDRMKQSYEDRTRFMLPRRTYTIVRVDGKAFHTWTRHLERPYSRILANAMDQTAVAFCKEAQGSAFAFVQSDEISVLLTDFATDQTQAWFDGNLQKIVSISAACATATFNALGLGTPVMFDARAFTIADVVEVENYFIWRQNDAERNSIQMLAQSLYSHGELHGEGIKEMHDLLHAKGVNWNDIEPGFKRGRVVRYETETGWRIEDNPPVFTRDRGYLRQLLPTMRTFSDSVVR